MAIATKPEAETGPGHPRRPGASRGSRRPVLRHAGLGWLLAGGTVGAVGNAITPVAVAFAVLDLGGSAMELGLVEAVLVGAQVITTLAGGVLGDRVSRKLMMEGSSLASALVTGLLAATVLFDAASLPLIAVFAALSGVLGALAQPSSRAIIRLVVPESELGEAVALRALLLTSGQTVGYVLAGLLVASVGSGWAIMVDAATFAFAALAFSRLRVPHVRTPQVASVLADLGDGFREVMRHTWLWLLILQALLYHLFYGGAQAVLGPIVVGEGIGRSAWGFAMAALMGGFVMGGLVTLRFRPRHPLRVGVVLLAATGLFPLAMALSSTLWPILLGAFLHGVGLQIFSVFWEQSIQFHVPEEKLSRVYSFDIAGSFAVRPLGLALTGPIAVAVGYQNWLIVVAVVIGGASLVALSSRDVRRLERAPR